MRELLWIRNGCTPGEGSESLHHYNLTIREGTITFVYGYEGYYTQALADVVCGKLALSSGSMWFRDREILTAEDRRILEKEVFYSDFSDQIIDSLSILDNLVISMKQPGSRLYHRRRLESQVEMAMAEAGIHLSPGSLAQSLSVVDRYRLCLIKAILTGAGMIVINCADSSFIQFDIREIMPLIRRLHDRGRTFLIIARNPSEIGEMADYYQIIDHGMDVRAWRKGDMDPWVDEYRLESSKRCIRRGRIALIPVRAGDSIWESMDSFRRRDAEKPLYDELPKGAYAGESTVIIPAHSEEQLLYNLSVEDNLLFPLRHTEATHGILHDALKKYVLNSFLQKVQEAGEKVQPQGIVFRKMLSIERMVLNQPAHLVLEEPCAGMNNAQGRRLLRYVMNLAEEGPQIWIFTSADRDFLLQGMIEQEKGKIG